MEIRKGSVPQPTQKQTDLDSVKSTDSAQPAQSFASIPDSLETAGPLSEFEQIEKRAQPDLSARKGGPAPDYTEQPEDVDLERRPDLSYLLKNKGEESTPLPKFVVNTDRLELQQRLQDAMDSTLAIRMKEQGASATEIAAALHGQDQSAAEVARTLKELGFSGEEVAVALRNEYGLFPAQTAQTMKDAGFDATQIAKGLKEAFGQDPGQVRDILEALGFTQGEIADAMWGAFQIGEYTTLD